MGGGLNDMANWTSEIPMFFHKMIINSGLKLILRTLRTADFRMLTVNVGVKVLRGQINVAVKTFSIPVDLPPMIRS